MTHVARLRELQASRLELPAEEAPAFPPAPSGPFGSTRSEQFWRDLLPPGLPGWADQLGGLSIPDGWKGGLLRVDQVLPPVRFADWQWQRLLRDVRHIAVDWGQAAAAAGWTLHELFGRAPMYARRLDLDGVAMLLEGRKISRVDDGAIIIENGGRATHAFRRKRMHGSRLLWEPL